MVAPKKKTGKKKSAAPAPKRKTPPPVSASWLSAKLLKKRIKNLANSTLAKRLTRRVTAPNFSKYYVVGALAILLLSTVFWAILGSRLQQANADQLVNAYLFQDKHTLQTALFPGQHTFLLKWPLFLLIKLFSFSKAGYVAVTVGTVVATVSMLAAIIYKIERRPLVFGTLCLALASVLMLVPAQPYAGALLPVNMAMVTTRNLEYIVYIVGLGLLVRAPRLKDWRFGSGVAVLTLLAASDKLFLTLSLGGALLAITAYGLSRSWKLVTLSVDWLVGGLIAVVASMAAVGLVTGIHITKIADSGSGPYGLVHSFKDVVLGVIYAVSGFFTNLGANPAFDATRLSQIPHQLASRLFGVGGFSFSVNILIAVCGLYACYRLLLISLKKSKIQPSVTQQLSLLMVWSSLGAIGLFIASNHYYAVDARYLGITLFTLFVSLANFGRQRRWQPLGVVVVGAIMILSVVFGSLSALSTYHDDSQALDGINQRNATVAQTLTNHKVTTLVGDYWRVLPIKSESGGKQPILPLQTCTSPRTVLSSGAWQKNLNNHSFAYLMSFDKSLTDYPHCSLDQVFSYYGRPNVSTLIAGNQANPKELLLFYDGGIHHSSPKLSPTSESTVLPIGLDELPHTSCAGPTVMNIVAHQDDDLLFLSPDLLHSVQAGDCVRTVYVTAGDSGSNSGYWQSREQGSEAAYASMLKTKDIWVQRIVKLPNQQFVTVANPRGNAKISLIFMRLPDGNIDGGGFGASHHESLASLNDGHAQTMHTIDGQSHYTSSQVVDALSSMMHTYQPAEIRTQSTVRGTVFPDHSDHETVGAFAKRAHDQYQTQQFRNELSVPIKFYSGYPIHALPSNVSDGDLASKEAAFLAYAMFDGGVCRSASQCDHSATYGSYLSRQYQQTH